MMTGEDKKRRIFISAATGEFRSLRLRLAGSLQRAGFEVEHQDIFPNVSADTVRKLAELLEESILVIHLVGHKPGSVANAQALKDLFSIIPEKTLLPEHAEVRKALGDFSNITYTQWEAFFALHFGAPLLVYAPADAENIDTFPQKEHLTRLKLAGRYPEWCADEAEYFAKILPDVYRELGVTVEPITQEIAPPKFLNHAAENFIGREDELALLDDAWDNATELVNVLSMIAWGGVGKTALLAEWIQQRFIAREWNDENGEPELWRYFDWSFYEQGTTSDDDDDAAGGKIAVRTGSVGDFFERALNFFGDPDPNLPGKGARLAQLVQQQRSLLILDGMEPLQQPFNHPQAGQLIDNDLHDLLCALALKNPGLCVITSRQPLADLSGLRNGASKESLLSELPIETAIRLLRNLQITGTDDELAEASEAFGRHALSLTLLGRFLYDAHGGDIRKRDLIDLQDADDATRPDRKRTAWKVLEVYDAWLASATGRPEELAILRLTGLFDRPANANCLAALRAEPVIPDLTDALVGLSESRWNILLNRLERAHLIALRQEHNGAKGIDAHPLIREYFSKQLLKEQTDAFKTAHSRLFDHLCENTEHQPDTLKGLQALYQAVVHGCRGDRQEETCVNVYRDRILRGVGIDGFYSQKKLGGYGADLAACSAFFLEPWSKLSPNLSDAAQAWLLSVVAFNLRALGRTVEALDPMRSALERAKNASEWTQAANGAANICDLKVTLGQLQSAVSYARQAVELSDRSYYKNLQCFSRAALAQALHQQGEWKEAEIFFKSAEALLQKFEPNINLLYSINGFEYCDIILAPVERFCWDIFCKVALPVTDLLTKDAIDCLSEVEHRAIEAQRLRRKYVRSGSLLDEAMDKLTIARVSIFRHYIDSTNPDCTGAQIRIPLEEIRIANEAELLAKALLTAALHEHFTGDPDIAHRHLDEAQQIAERGPMPLYLADVHLHRARLFREKAELTLAAELIHKHQYGRRYEELEDAEAASVDW